MASGIADPNPYDGIDLDKVDLWSYDHYHASHYGYYLEALVVFGNLTGLDPRSLGVNECSGYELGMSRTQIQMLQQAAYDQLASEGRVEASPLESTDPALRCTATEPQAPCPAANHQRPAAEHSRGLALIRQSLAPSEAQLSVAQLVRSEYGQSGSAWARTRPRGFRSADCLHAGRLKRPAHSVADDCQTVLSYSTTR